MPYITEYLVRLEDSRNVIWSKLSPGRLEEGDPSCKRPGAHFSKAPVTFRARKAIYLLTCFQGNKKNNEGTKGIDHFKLPGLIMEARLPVTLL